MEEGICGARFPGGLENVNRAICCRPLFSIFYWGGSSQFFSGGGGFGWGSAVFGIPGLSTHVKKMAQNFRQLLQAGHLVGILHPLVFLTDKFFSVKKLVRPTLRSGGSVTK